MAHILIQIQSVCTELSKRNSLIRISYIMKISVSSGVTMGGGGGARAAPNRLAKSFLESDSRHTHMSVDPGGMGDISPPPPNILGGGMACIITPPPPPILFHG